MFLRAEPPSGDWVVELRKMGARLTVHRSPAHVKRRAEVLAADLSKFLGVPLVRDASAEPDAGRPAP